MSDDARLDATRAALAGHGITGQSALVAVKLLDGLEYDATDRPTNLVDRLAAARALYGGAAFAPSVADEDAQVDAALARLMPGRFGGVSDPLAPGSPHVDPAALSGNDIGATDAYCEQHPRLQ